MAKQNIMTVASLRKLLDEFDGQICDDFQVWLSSDEEGNYFSPVFENPRFCLAIEPQEKRIILFPSNL